MLAALATAAAGDMPLAPSVTRRLVEALATTRSYEAGLVAPTSRPG